MSDLQDIPGVGPSIEQDFVDLGYFSVAELQGANPEQLYQDLCDLRGEHIDRCVLYVFRCAVYYANVSEPEAELLKWWNWKEKENV
tara:strand:- start:239311 stop:239568 length:258 start_codon:yes stop_codon:yes gene_type:complete